MIQVKCFGLNEDKEANDFIKTKRLIENGVQIRDNVIVILYDDASHFDEKSREVLLIQTLASAEAKLLECQVLKEQFELAEASGTPNNPKFDEDKRQNQFLLDWSTARIYVVKKLMGLETHGMSVFGKKQYTAKEAKKK